MEIDHVFTFVEGGGAELTYLRSLGLTETYRRAHPGQGTHNICFCFDNMFLECLWVSDIVELRSKPVARTGLYERSQWRTAGTNPFGIAWRTAEDGDGFHPASWEYRPPYLPAGMSIEVAVDGDDPRQPMMFRSPGGTSPSQWSFERRREMQRPAGLGCVSAIRLELPVSIAPSPTLAALAERTSLEVRSVSGAVPFLTLEVDRLDRGEPLVVRLPADP